MEIEVYFDNTPSLRACMAAGFTQDYCRERKEDGRRVLLLSSSISSLEFVSPDRRLRYQLTDSGKPFYSDIYFEHLAIADSIATSLKEIQGVEAILALGSIAHRYADKWSDLDLAVLGRGCEIRQLCPGEKKLSGLSLDFFVVDLDASDINLWDVERRQAFEEGVILYSGDVRLIERIREGVRLSQEERARRVGAVLLELGWMGFQPRSWFGRIRYGYTWEIPYDLWLRRGSSESGHFVVNKAIDLVLQLLYLANEKHVPDLKWRRFLVDNLEYLPQTFAVLLGRAELCDVSREGFEVRANALLDLVEILVAYLESQGCILPDIYQSYLQSVDY